MPFRHRVQEFEMVTALLVLFLVALSSQPHADAQAPRHLNNPDSQRTSSLSGQMSIRFLQNSTYTFALCLPLAPDGRTPYEILIEIHPMLLRDADVRFIIRHYSPRPASLPSPDYTNFIPLRSARMAQGVSTKALFATPYSTFQASSILIFSSMSTGSRLPWSQNSKTIRVARRKSDFPPASPEPASTCRRRRRR